MSFSGRLHVTELKSAGGCFVEGRMSCASIFSSYFSLADKIILITWSLDASSNLKWCCLCEGFTAIQTSAGSSTLKKRWLDKVSPCRHEKWWGCPENPGGLHVPSWESGNTGCPCPISAAWHSPTRHLVFSWRAKSQVRYTNQQRNFDWFQVPYIY